MKAIRMRVTSTVIVTAPMPDTNLTQLTDDQRSLIRRKMKLEMEEKAKAQGAKLTNLVISNIEVVDVK